MALGYKSPFGLNRWVLLVWYTFVMSATSYIVGGVDPLKRLLFLNGTGSHTLESVADRRIAIDSIVNRSFAGATALSHRIATISSYSNPRNSALITLACFIVGLVLLFFAEIPLVNTAGAVIVGASFTASFNAHVSIANLFPSASEVAYDFIGSGPDISTVVPLILYHMAENMDSTNAVETVIQLYIAFVIVLGVIHFFMMPSESYALRVSKKYQKRMEDTPKREHKNTGVLARRRLFRKLKDKLHREDGEDGALANITFVRQVFHPMFWMAAGFFAANLWRKYYVMSNFRFICEEYGRDEGVEESTINMMVESLNIVNALAFIPTTYCARLGSNLGAWFGTIVCTVSSFITLLIMTIPSFWAQSAVPVFFSLWASYIYANVFTIVSEYFGMTNLSTVQGSVMTIAGVATLLYPNFFDLLGNPFIREVENTSTVLGMPLWYFVQICMLILSAICFVMPIYEYSFATRHVRSLRDKRDIDQLNQKLERVEQERTREREELNRQIERDPAQAEALRARYAGKAQQDIDELVSHLEEMRTPESRLQMMMAADLATRMAHQGVDLDAMISAQDAGEDVPILTRQRRRSGLAAMAGLTHAPGMLNEEDFARFASQFMARQLVHSMGGNRDEDLEYGGGPEAVDNDEDLEEEDLFDYEADNDDTGNAYDEINQRIGRLGDERSALLT